MKIVVIGSAGRLGAALTREYHNKFAVTGFNHAQLDLSDFDVIREKLRRTAFDVLINAAAFTNVDLCETERDQAFRSNAEAPRVLAEICREKNAKLIHFSTDYVFDGEKRKPYTEEDEAKPSSVYGDSKLAGEKNVLVKAKTVDAVKLKDMTRWVARRPVYSVLSTAKYTKLTSASPRPWRDAVADYIRRSYCKE